MSSHWQERKRCGGGAGAKCPRPRPRQGLIRGRVRAEARRTPAHHLACLLRQGVSSAICTSLTLPHACRGHHALSARRFWGDCALVPHAAPVEARAENQGYPTGRPQTYRERPQRGRNIGLNSRSGATGVDAGRRGGSPGNVRPQPEKNTHQRARACIATSAS